MERGRSPRILRALALIAGSFVVLAAVVFYLARPRYGFLGFESEQRISAWALASGKLGPEFRCYTFRSPAAEVMPAVEKELTSAGWKVDYSDPALRIFTRKQGGFAQEAFLAARTADWNDVQESAPTTSALWIPYRSTWVEDHMAALLMRLGLAARPTPTLVQPYGQDPCAILSASGSRLNVVWRNLDRFPVKIRIDAVDVENYDTDSNLPETVELAPREGKLETFAFPSPAGRQPFHGINIELTYLDPPNGKLWLWGSMPEPGLSAGKDDDGNVVKIVNSEKSRAFELRNLETDSAGETHRLRPGTIELQPGTSLGLHMKTSEADEPSISYDYRLLPNKRWRHFEYGDE